MAAQLKLVRGTDTIDLLSGDDGFYLARGGWARQIPYPDENGRYPDELIEALTLNTTGATSQDDLASKYSALIELMRKASDYSNEPLDKTPIFLQAQLSAETEAYRAMVKRWGLVTSSDHFSAPVAPGAVVLGDTLTLVRTPFWETTSDTTLVSTALDCFGGVQAFWESTGTGGRSNIWADTVIPGNVPARIGLTRFTRENSSATDITEIWAGFYTERFGSMVDNFYNDNDWRMDLHDPDTLGADCTNTTDTGDYGSGVVSCTFATTTAIAERIIKDLDLFGTGRFLILLRARCTGTRTYNVRMGYGYRNSTQWNRRGRVKISGTSYKLYPLGEILSPTLAHANEIANFDTASEDTAIRLEAEVNTDGTGNLYFDAVVLIPTAESWIHISSTEINYSPVKEYVEVSTDPGMTYSGLTYGAGTTAYSIPSIEPARNYGFPTDHDGVVVVAAQRSASHNLDDEISVRFDLYPRWAYLRGADA